MHHRKGKFVIRNIFFLEISLHLKLYFLKTNIRGIGETSKQICEQYFSPEMYLYAPVSQILANLIKNSLSPLTGASIGERQVLFLAALVFFFEITSFGR